MYTVLAHCGVTADGFHKPKINNSESVYILQCHHCTQVNVIRVYGLKIIFEKTFAHRESNFSRERGMMLFVRTEMHCIAPCHHNSYFRHSNGWGNTFIQKIGRIRSTQAKYIKSYVVYRDCVILRGTWFFFSETACDLLIIMLGNPNHAPTALSHSDGCSCPGDK